MVLEPSSLSRSTVIYSYMLSESSITDVVEVSTSGGQVIEHIASPPLPSLTLDEDTFCLAVIEYGGNLRKAFQEVYGVDISQPTARARALIARPEIQVRIQDLGSSVTEQSLISIGSHMVELAEIRDLSKAQGNVKTALDAEVQRGKVAGFYVGKSDSAPLANPNTTPAAQVYIQISTPHDQSI